MRYVFWQCCKFVIECVAAEANPPTQRANCNVFNGKGPCWMEDDIQAVRLSGRSLTDVHASGGHKILFTERALHDFGLPNEAKITSSGNSGQYFVTELARDGLRVRGANQRRPCRPHTHGKPYRHSIQN